MKQFEVNQLRAKLHRLDLSDDFIARYIQKLQADGENYKVALRRWIVGKSLTHLSSFCRL